MEDFYMNITSWDNSYDYSNITSNYSNITSNYSNISSNYSNITYNYSNITYNYSNITDNYSNITSDNEENTIAQFIMDVLTCVIIGVGLSSTFVAIHALYSQVRNDQVAPIYIINLLISDLIQFCCMIVWVVPTVDQKIIQLSIAIYISVLTVSICFMVCIALERYLVVAHPLWYRCRRTIKISVVVCVVVWVLAPAAVLTLIFCVRSQVRYIIFGVVLLLPFPLVIFLLGGTLKALSVTRVPSDEKRRIVAVLVLVLLIYTLLFLPSIVVFLVSQNKYRDNFTLFSVSSTLAKFSPLADLTLYVFMRKGTVDKLLSSVCCCRMDSDDTNSPSV